MGKWRPEGWSTDQQESAAFEAGADAMLKALKEKGAWMTPEQMKLLAPDRQYLRSYIVFIPCEFDWDAPWLLLGWRVVKIGTIKRLPNGEPAIENWTFHKDASAPALSANDLKRMVESSHSG